MSMILKAKKKGWISGPAPYYKVTGGGSPVFTFKGSDTTSSSSVAFTSSSLSAGAATSDRFVIIALADQSAVGIASVTVNGVSLSPDVQNTSNMPGVYIWSGLIGAAGGTTAAIVATFNAGAAFTDRTLSLWTGTGMAHTAGAVQTASAGAGSSPVTISVNSGDFLIANAMSNVVNAPNVTYASSTQAPTALRTETSSTSIYVQVNPEWNTITSTNAAFSMAPASFVSLVVAASYR